MATVIETLVAGVAPHVAATPASARATVLDECSRLMRRALWFALSIGCRPAPGTY